MIFVDPSGNIPVDCYGTDYCGASNSDLLPDFNPVKSITKDERDDDVKPLVPQYGNGLIGPPVPQGYYEIHPLQPVIDPRIASINNYCGGPVNLACSSYMFQDGATILDFVGMAFIEIPIVAAGCKSGGLWGCAAGEAAAFFAWQASPINATETALSGISFGLIVLDDALNNGGLGENTYTAGGTFLAGLVNTASGDFIVDGYASGYNHGIFNGLHTILSGGSLLKK